MGRVIPSLDNEYVKSFHNEVKKERKKFAKKITNINKLAKENKFDLNSDNEYTKALKNFFQELNNTNSYLAADLASKMENSKSPQDKEAYGEYAKYMDFGTKQPMSLFVKDLHQDLVDNITGAKLEHVDKTLSNMIFNLPNAEKQTIYSFGDDRKVKALDTLHNKYYQMYEKEYDDLKSYPKRLIEKSRLGENYDRTTRGDKTLQSNIKNYKDNFTASTDLNEEIQTGQDKYDQIMPRSAQRLEEFRLEQMKLETSNPREKEAYRLLMGGNEKTIARMLDQMAENTNKPTIKFNVDDFLKVAPPSMVNKIMEIEKHRENKPSGVSVKGAINQFVNGLKLRVTGTGIDEAAISNLYYGLEKMSERGAKYRDIKNPIDFGEKQKQVKSFVEVGTGAKQDLEKSQYVSMPASAITGKPPKKRKDTEYESMPSNPSIEGERKVRSWSAPPLTRQESSGIVYSQIKIDKKAIETIKKENNLGTHTAQSRKKHTPPNKPLPAIPNKNPTGPGR